MDKIEKELKNEKSDSIIISSSNSLENKEEIIELENSNDSLLEMGKKIFKILHLFFLWILIKSTIFSFSLLKSISKNEHSFQTVFFYLILTNIIELIIYIFFYFKFTDLYPMFKPILMNFIFQNIFVNFIFLGFFLYGNYLIGIGYLLVLVMPGFVMCTLSFFYFYRNPFFIFFSRNWFNYLQVILIPLNFIFQGSWNVFLLIFEIETTVFYIFGWIMAFFLCVYLFYFIFKLKCRISLETISGLYICLLFVFIAYLFIFAYYFFQTFKLILINNLYRSNESVKLLSIPGFYQLNKVFLIFLLITFVIINILYFIILYYLNLMAQKRGRFLSIISYAKNLKVGLTQISENFFKKTNNEKNNLVDSNEEEEILLLDKKESKCMICQDNQNEIIIRPCGHSGFCEKCIIKHLKSKIFCPICRHSIEKAIIIKYDEENSRYITNKIIKMN